MASFLADDTLHQPFFHFDELVAFAFLQAGNGNASPARDDLGNVLFGDFLFERGYGCRPFPVLFKSSSCFCSSGNFPVLDFRSAVRDLLFFAPARVRF